MSSNNSLHTMDLFSRFFQENQERFLSFAYSYTRNKAAAEDILMEAMISLWENREKWEKDSNLHALLLTIIKNKSLNYLEHEQVRMRAEEPSTHTNSGNSTSALLLWKLVNPNRSSTPKYNALYIKHLNSYRNKAVTSLY
jgi:RNA polymerase sigma factor (sigma-70 family)